jgi:hypothetical protein
MLIITTIKNKFDSRIEDLHNNNNNEWIYHRTEKADETYERT